MSLLCVVLHCFFEFLFYSTAIMGSSELLTKLESNTDDTSVIESSESESSGLSGLSVSCELDSC